jgi:hypothetical protein
MVLEGKEKQSLKDNGWLFEEARKTGMQIKGLPVDQIFSDALAISYVV